MLRFASLAAATCLVIACPAPRAPATHDDTRADTHAARDAAAARDAVAARIAIARAEVTRAIDDLRRRATASGDVRVPASGDARVPASGDARVPASGDARVPASGDEQAGGSRMSTSSGDERVLALRALGRIGGDDVMPILVEALRDPDPRIVAAGAGAIGVAAQLDEPAPSAEVAARPASVGSAVTAQLVAALDRVPDAQRAVVLEAIGRAGDRSALPALVARLRDPSPAIVDTAALALARFGRRKLPLDADARAALIPLLSAGPAARYAATYAFAREHEPPPDLDPASPLTAALVARLGDDDPQTRAQAVAALGKRGLLAGASERRARVVAMLDDADWRVAVEAVRVLAADDEGQDAIAAMLPRRYTAIAKDPREAQVVIEGARALVPDAGRAAVRAALEGLVRQPAVRARHDVAYAWIDCLARSGLARVATPPDYGFVEACMLPAHLKLPLLADAVTAKVGTIAQRRAAVARLLGDASDPRVRAAGVGALAELWDESTETERRETIASLVDAVRAPQAMVAGAAVEAAGAIYGKGAGGKLSAAERAPLDKAIVERARTERDAELGASLLELVGTQHLAAGLEACRAALGADPVRAKAARACVIALGDAPPPVPVHAPLVAPPYDVAAVIGHHLVWHLVTTRGAIDIALRPDVAPWAVATIAGLTRKGFYDGLEIHRVVGNFVVQGGDPTSSGWGGPGFTLPAEPSTLADGPGFAAGGVGMADAGRDSAGSQWFVMHGRAPHLDGRYTWVGSVISGQPVADALVIGDKVVTATMIE